MILSKKLLKNIGNKQVVIPNEELFGLPEKVLQFGTGVLLRGLPDYFIDKANRQGIFNGRVVVVKSTGNDTSAFDNQDSLYTIGIRGIEDGQLVEENVISSAISRVLSAEKDWAAILAVAVDPELKLIISNTTEVGIRLLNESIVQQPPVSFPAKLLSVLYERYKIFGHTANGGLVIIATELISDNGKKLENIIYELAAFNQLEAGFVTWSKANNIFCNSLVDRIVPGKPDASKSAELTAELGYEDQLMILAEPYRLWAVEGNEQVADTLSFMKADTGLIVKPDIELYKELKVRLLNGTHTLTSGIAFLSGIDTVKNGMDNTEIRRYTEQLMEQEIAPAIPYQVALDDAIAFSKTVTDRFANPHIKHLWLSITAQYSMKMKIRVLPVLLNYDTIFHEIPKFITFGFASFLHFMRSNKEEGGHYYGTAGEQEYLITDESAAYFYSKIQEEGEKAYPLAILSDTQFWGTDLTELPGFINAVNNYYFSILEKGMASALEDLNKDGGL